MSLTYAQARDQILQILKDAWDPTEYKMMYDDVRDQKEQQATPWATATIRHVWGRNDSLGGVGHRSFLRIGTLIVTIHTPSSSGLSEAYRLAKVVTDAYEGISTPSGVWFRNARINEQGRVNAFYQTNVLIDFEYNEVK